MELNQNQNENQDGGGGGGGGGGVIVMTDEQVEILRKQIAIFIKISHNLFELYKSLLAHQDLSGGRVGNMCSDPTFSGITCQKLGVRQRWTPSSAQLQILEQIFEQGNGIPGKERIKEIASELLQHGPIQESNVYNWFQNRRARCKRKQRAAPSNNVSLCQIPIPNPVAGVEELKGMTESYSDWMPEEYCMKLRE